MLAERELCDFFILKRQDGGCTNGQAPWLLFCSFIIDDDFVFISINSILGFVNGRNFILLDLFGLFL